MALPPEQQYTQNQQDGMLSGLADDYSNLRTIPAMLGVAFALTSLYLFGGIENVMLPWIDYTLTTAHSMYVSLAVFAVAFMSSETKQFENYEQPEQALIIATPALALAWEHITEVRDVFMALGDPLGEVVAFAITLIGWTVAVR